MLLARVSIFLSYGMSLQARINDRKMGDPVGLIPVKRVNASRFNRTIFLILRERSITLTGFHSVRFISRKLFTYVNQGSSFDHCHSLRHISLYFFSSVCAFNEFYSPILTRSRFLYPDFSQSRFVKLSTVLSFCYASVSPALSLKQAENSSANGGQNAASLLFLLSSPAAVIIIHYSISALATIRNNSL